jgi:hypothetical protein
MTAARRKSNAPVREVLESEDVREILRDSFFARPSPADGVATPVLDVDRPSPHARQPASALDDARRPRKRSKKATRPDHYKVICISLYNEDLALLDRVVKDLKKRGFTKASRSAVLRAAMQQFDPSQVTRGL